MTNFPLPRKGCKIYRTLDLDEGALEVIKASKGCLLGGWVCNTGTTTVYLKFYDATSGTAGTGTPVLTVPVPGNASDDIGAFFGAGGIGIQFNTGICVGATTGLADNDTGAPSANQVIANFFYI
jgi:hypothetical protein